MTHVLKCIQRKERALHQKVKIKNGRLIEPEAQIISIPE